MASEFTPDSAPDTADEIPHGFLPRPRFQLRSLSVPLRWEVTRRHPYYQDWWRWARAHHRDEPIESEPEALFRTLGVLALGMIGVTGEPPDPATEFEELGGQLNSAWLSGAVHPITFGGLAGLLCAYLSRPALKQLGEIFLAASEVPSVGREPQIEALMQLSTLKIPDLDKFPDEPFVSINPAASGRQVEEALQTLLPQWKDERSLPKQRARLDKQVEYLRVWDLREGWRGGAYHGSREKRFKEIAAELGVSVSTLSDHYQAAFRIITGYEYSPEKWVKFFASIKLLEFAQFASARRPLRSRSVKPVAESILLAGAEGQGPTAFAESQDDSELYKLVSDIRDLIRIGQPNEEIVNRLDLSEEALRAIEYLRSRGSEFE